MANYSEEAVWEGVRELEETDDCVSSVFNVPFRQLTRRTAKVKEMVETETAVRAGETGTLAGQVQSLQGRGGPITAHDFGSETPEREELTRYACEDIWGEGGVFVWDAENPRESTYTVENDGEQTVHTAGEVFNSTWVRNTYNGINHRIVLTNTPNTDPSVFSWADVGYDTVGIATETLPGLVRSGADVRVNPVTGEILVPALYLPSRFIIASDRREITIKADTFLVLRYNGKQYMYYTAVDAEYDIQSLLDTGSVQNGKDYYIFLCAAEQGEGVTLAVSLNKNNPAGYTAGQARLIGGFHTLCVGVGSAMSYVLGGTTLNHPLNGFVIGDILPASVWCLNHRPHSEPEGMVYIESLDFWCDIYLQSGSGANTKSAYQGAITRSRQYVDFVEDQFCVRKEPLDDGEFAAAMLGSNEQTAVSGASESAATTGGAGGRVDTANRRMISVYGVEEGCGSLWQWLRSTSAGGTDGAIYGQTGSGPAYGTLTMTTSAHGPYDQAGGKGKYWGLAGALLAGGYWDASSSCGSRARNADSSRSRAGANVGGRGRSRPMRGTA